ncbi:hypothetical protein F66182_5125 [Fusarium sp. NRRL 66182]|nr:hypothetical protein F66182_5125 [Fusarium sp. NRRL 66182]
MSQPRKFDRDAILTDPSLPTVYSTLVDLATEFAVLGEVETAKTLISLLLRDTTSDWQRDQVKDLETFLAESDRRPEDIPESERKRASSEDEDDEKQLTQWLDRARDEDPDRVPETQARALTDALVMAVKLASRKTTSLYDMEKDARVQEVLEHASKRLHAPTVIDRLAERQDVHRLLCAGALARKFPIDKSKIETLGKEVVTTFTERFNTGRQAHESETWSMKEILLQIERNTKANAVNEYKEVDQPVPETLFILPPTTNEQITGLKKRLDMTLPDDYKEFFKISNGFGRAWNGYYCDPGLHKVQDVSWIESDFEVPFLEFHESISGSQELQLSDGREWPSSGPMIEIESEDVLSVSLLPPKQAKSILEAYEEAMNGSDTSDDGKKQTLKVIKARYGSHEEMQKLAWFAVEQEDDQTNPCGTFRQLLEDKLRKSVKRPERDQPDREATSIAYSCLGQDSPLNEVEVWHKSPETRMLESC